MLCTSASFFLYPPSNLALAMLSLYIHPLALLTQAMLSMSASSLYPPSSLVNPGNAEYDC